MARSGNSTGILRRSVVSGGSIACARANFSNLPYPRKSFITRYQRRTMTNRIVDRVPMLFFEMTENRMQMRKMPAIMRTPLTALVGANWDSFSAAVFPSDSIWALRESSFSFMYFFDAGSAPEPPFRIF